MTDGNARYRTTDNRRLAYECFICFEPMTTDQDLIRNPTGIVTHRACMEDDE